MRKQKIAAVLEAVGVGFGATGAFLVAIPLGFAVLGGGMVLFGLALEREG